MSTKPQHTLTRGSIEVAIWENRSKNGAFLRATIKRRYRAADGSFQSSDSFGVKELGDVALLAIQSQAWMLDAQAALDTPASSDADPSPTGDESEAG
jgi:hypothetical protein